MRTSFGLSRSSGMCIEGRSVKESESRRTGGGFGNLVAVVDRVSLVDYPSPSGKCRGKISEIRYLNSSKYLKAAVKYADAVGPSRVEPLYERTFVTWYRPPLGVRVWCPDLLTDFENGLHFSLHPLIKNVLQHFNVCPSQLSPNFWGVLVGLLVFRDKGLKVPNITLLLDFFSVKEAA